MSDLLICDSVGTAKPISLVAFGARFGADNAAWRSAFFALALQKPIRFSDDGHTIFVAPYDANRLGFTARDFILDAEDEGMIRIATDAPKPRVTIQIPAGDPPEPNPTSQRPNMAVYRLVFGMRIEAACHILAADTHEAHAIFLKHFPRLKDQLLASAVRDAERLQHTKQIGVDDFDLEETEVDASKDPRQFPYLGA